MPSVLTPARTADPRPARHFSIGDGLILMAAAALSLERLTGMGWFTRFPVDLTWCWQEISRVGLWPPWDILFDSNLQAMRKDVVTRLADDVLIQFLSSLLVGFMVAQPLLRLRHPRPEPRQLIRQSGFVACMVSMGAALAAFAIVGMGWRSEENTSELQSPC